MRKWIYLSPHFDDVVLSAGGLVSEQTRMGDRVEIWTICAGDPPAGKPLTEYAQMLHFFWETGDDVPLLRSREDAACCHVLGASYGRYTVPDNIYRYLPGTDEAVVKLPDDNLGPLEPVESYLIPPVPDFLRKNVSAGSEVVVPLTIGHHRDHVLVRKAAERMDVFRHQSDMISVILNHRDEAFVGQDFHVLHPREELEAYMRLCTQHNVKPEFEVWSTGSIWNLNSLIGKGLVQPPYFATLFFGWPGGAWSPATIEEYLYRRRWLPQGCVVNVSIMGPEQIEILAAAIVRGDHVRVGSEDYPFKSGQVVATHELVEAAAEIARSVGRRVATVAEAREIIGV